jgi:hypothetical protein
MKVTFIDCESSTSTEKILENPRICKFSLGLFDGYDKFPAVQPQIKEGDILLIDERINDPNPENLKQRRAHDAKSVELLEIINLTHSEFDYCEFTPE